MKTTQSKSPVFPLFVAACALILAGAVVQRFFLLPPVPYADGDVSEYLNPALEYSGNNDFVPGAFRGYWYPLFVLGCISLGKSIYAIAFCQHILGLIGLIFLAKGFYELPVRSHFVRNATVMASLIFIGCNNELVILEHSIRPEGLSLFFTGLIFFSLQRFLRQPGAGVYLILVSANALLFLTQPKFVLGGAFIIAFSSVVLIRSRSFSAKAIEPVAVFALVLFSAWYFPKLNETPPPPLAENFFYINCRVIEQSKGFEQYFSANEKQALHMAVSAIRPDTNWAVLGFCADNLMDQKIRGPIERACGVDVYSKVMKKSVIWCFPAFVQKVAKQMTVYYFRFSRSERIPPVTYLQSRSALEDSRRFSGDMAEDTRALKAGYISAVQHYLATAAGGQAGSPWYLFILRLLAMIFSAVEIVPITVYCVYALFRRRAGIILLLMIMHFLVLLVITVVHTIDIGRYSQSLFPLYGIILLLGIMYAADAVVAKMGGST